MLPTKLLIGLLTFYILAQLICNALSGEDMLTSTNVIAISETPQTSATGVTEPDTGASAEFALPGSGFINRLKEIFLFDYPMFYDVRSGLSESQCSTAGGTWQSSTSTCKIANDFSLFRYMLIVVGFVTLIGVGLALKSIIKP